MTELTGGKGGGDYNRKPIDYLWDGYQRRKPHEFGVTGFRFYEEFFRNMDFRPGQVALDVAAGMGNDGLSIATTYGPQEVFLLEPKIASYGFIDRYYQLDFEVQRLGRENVVLLPAIREGDYEGIFQPDLSALDTTKAYLQPIEGWAEAIPLPDDSVDRLTCVHAAYEFDDLEAFLHSAARVMKPDAIGGLITNGPGDKRVLKQKMQEIKHELEADHPGEVEYQVPETVSSSLTYLEARDALKPHFNKVRLFTYHDRMKIDNLDRRTTYDFGFDTYRYKYVPPITNYGRWKNARRKIFGYSPDEDSEADQPVIYDTIDIGWILFSDPKRK